MSTLVPTRSLAVAVLAALIIPVVLVVPAGAGATGTQVPDHAQDDCGTGVDAGDQWHGAVRIVAPVSLCRADLYYNEDHAEWQDLNDWYAVAAAPGDVLTVDLYRYDIWGGMCVFAPIPEGAELGSPAACGGAGFADGNVETVRVDVDEAGDWLILISDGPFGGGMYKFTVALDRQDTEGRTLVGHRLAAAGVGVTAAAGPGTPEADGIDGAWIRLDEEATGAENARISWDAGARYRFRLFFHDADGVLIDHVCDGGPASRLFTTCTVPAGAAWARVAAANGVDMSYRFAYLH